MKSTRKGTLQPHTTAHDPPQQQEGRSSKGKALIGTIIVVSAAVTYASFRAVYQAIYQALGTLG